MKETKTKQQDETAEVRQKENHDEKQKLVGQLKPHRGHTTYKYNTVTGELVEAEYEWGEVDFNNPKKGRRKVTVEEGCIYVSALNIKNAVKKLSKYHGVNVKFK